MLLKTTYIVKSYSCNYFESLICYCRITTQELSIGHMPIYMSLRAGKLLTFDIMFNG